MTQIKAIFFDAAGTLLHAHPSVGHVYAEVLHRHGLVVDSEWMEGAFRSAFARRRAAPSPRQSNRERLCNDRDKDVPNPGERDFSPLDREGYDWWRTLVFEVLDSLHVTVRDPDHFFHELYWRFAEPDVWRLFPDALPALLEMRGRGLKIALVSNWDVRLRRLIEGMGIAGLFDALVISTEVGIEKPDPRIFRLACERLGVEPSEALHVGDHAREDIEGATAAGVGAVLLDRKQQAEGQRAVISSLRKLDPVIV